MSARPASDLRFERERVVRAHVAAECRRDVAGTVGTFADPNYDIVALGEPSRGAAAVEEYLSGLFTGLPDMQVDLGPLHHSDEIVFVEATISGTHDGPLFGIAASGRTLRFRAGCTFHFDGVDLVKETVYFDTMSLLRDVGLLPKQGSRTDRFMLRVMSLGIRVRRMARPRSEATGDWLARLGFDDRKTR